MPNGVSGGWGGSLDWPGDRGAGGYSPDRAVGILADQQSPVLGDGQADRLVAHEAALQATVVFLGSQGGIRGAVRGAVSGQGLFTTQLHGVGAAAVLSHGGTIAIPVDGSRPVAVDPQAYVAHVGQVQVDISASVGWRDAVGRGSGEAVQLRLTGNGTVYVQASEQKL